MKILVVSENFTKGGLETNIFSQYEELSNKDEFVFAFGNYDKTYKLNAPIYEGLKFNKEETIQDFLDDTNKLIEIIKEHNIDVIHVHPIYSIFPAMFASQITKTPIVYTYHGYGSYTFPNNNIIFILFNWFLTKVCSSTFLVNMMGYNGFAQNLNLNNITFLPNAINMNQYLEKGLGGGRSKKWALISRLDDDKYSEIYKFILGLKELDIDTLEIYGDGNRANDLKELVNKKRLNKKVKFMGYCSDLNNKLDESYSGVIGIGRVVLESLAMGYPTIIIGFSKIGCLIDKDAYLQIKDYNFINEKIDDTSFEVLNEQVKDSYRNRKKYNLRKEVAKEFSTKTIWQKYQSVIEQLSYEYGCELYNLYNDIKNKVQNDEKFANSSFYESADLYFLLKKHIEYRGISNDIKISFLEADHYFNMKYELSLAKSDNYLLSRKLEELEQKTRDLEESMNFVFLIKNTWRKIKRKLKRGK